MFQREILRKCPIVQSVLVFSDRSYGSRGAKNDLLLLRNIIKLKLTQDTFALFDNYKSSNKNKYNLGIMHPISFLQTSSKSTASFCPNHMAHVLVQAQYTNGETRWTGKGSLECQITKYQIRNILFLLYMYGLIIVIHLNDPQPIQLVLNPFN